MRPIMLHEFHSPQGVLEQPQFNKIGLRTVVDIRRSQNNDQYHIEKQRLDA